MAVGPGWELLPHGCFLTSTQQARSQGSIMFKVVPITERPVHRHMMVGAAGRLRLRPLPPSSRLFCWPPPQLHVRALVSYDPQQDPSIPCAEAGVGFRRGDILEIVDQTDALWWQARRLPSEAGCAGLVPSSSLLQRCDLPPPTGGTPSLFQLSSGARLLVLSVANRKQRELWWSQPYLPHTCAQICKPRPFTCSHVNHRAETTPSVPSGFFPAD